ncbi:XRE family transcriptional regulator [Lentibacter algarum]|uniref:XRE family transcriptional regulator n=1 Tax=Lentibacter algarum TaxID=576131 RepID=UPI00339D50DF
MLLEPVDSIAPKTVDVFHHPIVEDFLGKSGSSISESEFPSGVFRFSRPSFVSEEQFVIGLLYVFRRDGQTFVRGFEAKQAMLQQGIEPTVRNREIRGILIKQEQGVAILAARRGSTTCSFSFLSRVASFQNNYWEGYAARTIAESITGQRVARMVFEHVSGNTEAMLSTARLGGLCSTDDLPAYHARLLRLGQVFQ